jgi:hypothetical protein
MKVCANVKPIIKLTDICDHYSALADDVNAMYLTRSDHFGVHLNKNGKPKKFTGELNTEDDILGPLTILFDMWRAQGWDIVSHGGFVTFTHHDVSGFCTYVFPRSG